MQPFDPFRLTHPTAIAAEERRAELGWRPLVDVYEDRGGWLVKFDLAGVRLEDIDLFVQGSRLTIRGIRRDWRHEERQQCHRLEISYNRFERSIDFPADLASHRIATEYRDGMLLVRLEREEPSR